MDERMPFSAHVTDGGGKGIEAGETQRISSNRNHYNVPKNPARPRMPDGR